MAGVLIPARLPGRASGCIRCASVWRRSAARSAWRAARGRARASQRSARPGRRMGRSSRPEMSARPMIERISVLIVDDHDVVRQGIRAFLATQSDLEIVGEAASGAEAIRLAQEHIPDVVLMDLVMPGMDGVEATRAVKRVSPRSQIVVLTSYYE